VPKLQPKAIQTATAKTARDINRRILLNLIRKYQPVSRAELSRHSHLQRSTVSDITAQLISERWVSVGALGELPRGRRPTFLHLNEDRAAIIGVDIRPIETAIAVADLSMRFLMQEVMPTGSDPEEFAKQLSRRLRNIISSDSRIRFEGIGVALPGRIDLGSGCLAFAPNLGWTGFDLKRPLEKATGLSVELENAANACALVQLWHNPQPEAVRNLVAVTVSEEVSVGMILNGQLVRGSTGLAGEFAHVTVQPNGAQCKCGNRGCLDACASEAAAVGYFLELEANQHHRPVASGLDFHSVLKWAEQGNPSAGKALDRMAHWLGVGAAMLTTGLAPDVIAIVGEVTRAWERVGPIIQRTVRKNQPKAIKTRVVATNPGMQSRLRGAIALVLQQHFGSPPHLLNS
jgi:predicted NBD/HSP70 family sugar kinase